MERPGFGYALASVVLATLAIPPASVARDAGMVALAQTPIGAEDARDVLLRGSLSMAKSDDPGDHKTLFAQLRTPGYLTRLDSEQDYAAASRFRPRVEQVIKAMADNPAPSAREAFLGLTRSRVVLADDDRRLALIRAGESIRPAPLRLVAFWDRHSRVDDIFTPTTIPVLVANGSEPALRLFAKKLADPSRRKDERIAWLHTSVLTHRNDHQLLLACERMLKNGLPKNLRPFLVESLFDYRPGEWFRPASHYSAPPLREASSQVLALLSRLGELALRTASLTPRQRDGVVRRLGEISELGKEGSHP